MITVYYKPGCYYSKSAIVLLKNKKIAYEKITLRSETKQSEIKKRNNYPTFPQILDGVKFIGGYDELCKYIQQ